MRRSRVAWLSQTSAEAMGPASWRKFRNASDALSQTALGTTAMTNRALELSWDIPERGETIAGKYVIEAPCGRGGLAVVLSAMHLGLDRRVAIKVLLPEWAGDAEVVRRFVREGRTATRIKSEHVVRVFDVGTLESGAPYLVLEYLEGHNLEDIVTNWGPVAVPTAIDWVLQAAEAIAEAHAHGIVHRDLKPANLFLTRRADGSACVKVIDFGLSKLNDPRLRGVSKITLPTDVMGSPHYMAPEQLKATCNADERADLWALGAVLHELITAQPPFQGETVAEICATVLTQPTPRISSIRANVPPGLERAVLRCLEKDPAARFATVAEMAYAIAPFGTAVAGRSYERIARMAGPPAPAVLPSTPTGLSNEVTLPSLPSLPPALLEDGAQGRASWPSDLGDPDYPRRVAGTDASARVVLGSLLMLAGVGAGVFMFMYSSVHGLEPRTREASPFNDAKASPSKAPQPTAQGAPPEAKAPPAPPVAAPMIPAQSAAEPPVALPPAPAENPLPAPSASQPPAVVALPALAAPLPPHSAAPPAALAAVPAAPPPAKPKAHVAPGARPQEHATGNAWHPVAAPKVGRDGVVQPPRIPPATLAPAPAEAPDRSNDAPTEKAAPAGDDLFDGRK
jgi:eukaryotic-like serine/threonine-protein kinase